MENPSNARGSEDPFFKVNEKSHKGELQRQSPVSDGEAVIKVQDDAIKQKFKGFHSESIDIQDNLANEEEKTRLIEQVLALQSTLDDLSQRVDAVKDENLKLKSENQVLGQYIENLMAASNVFQATGDTKGRKGCFLDDRSKKGRKQGDEFKGELTILENGLERRFNYKSSRTSKKR